MLPACHSGAALGLLHHNSHGGRFRAARIRAAENISCFELQPHTPLPLHNLVGKQT